LLPKRAPVVSAGRRSANMRVRDVMTRDVATCTPDDNMADAAAMMWKHDCGSIPVVMADGTVIAMITDRDICMAALSQGRRLQEMGVRGAASQNVVAVQEADDIEVALRLMDRSQVRRLPVLDARSKLIGIVTLNDVARASQNPEARESLGSDRIAGTLAGIGRHEQPTPALAAQ
jgi:CBS domain-containing protein